MNRKERFSRYEVSNMSFYQQCQCKLVTLYGCKTKCSDKQELSHDSIARLNCALPITNTISVIR